MIPPLHLCATYVHRMRMHAHAHMWRHACLASSKGGKAPRMETRDLGKNPCFCDTLAARGVDVQKEGLCSGQEFLSDERDCHQGLVIMKAHSYALVLSRFVRTFKNKSTPSFPPFQCLVSSTTSVFICVPEYQAAAVLHQARALHALWAQQSRWVFKRHQLPVPGDKERGLSLNHPSAAVVEMHVVRATKPVMRLWCWGWSWLLSLIL